LVTNTDFEKNQSGLKCPPWFLSYMVILIFITYYINYLSASLFACHFIHYLSIRTFVSYHLY